jgi:hypothetical protein
MLAYVFLVWGCILGVADAGLIRQIKQKFTPVFLKRLWKVDPNPS